MNAQVQVPGLGVISFTAWAATMNTPVGLLAKGDLLQFQLDGGTMALAFALGFGRTHASNEHVAFVEPTSFQNSFWLKVPNIISIVPAQAILGAVPFFADGCGYRALMIATS